MKKLSDQDWFNESEVADLPSISTSQLQHQTEKTLLPGPDKEEHGLRLWSFENVSGLVGHQLRRQLLDLMFRRNQLDQVVN